MVSQRSRSTERGQAMVEFALLFSLIVILTMSAADVALGFYQYNSLAGAVRYAARWGSVVGSTSACQSPSLTTLSESSDWCNQNGNLSAGSQFWDECGNASLQKDTTSGASVTCTNSLGQQITTGTSTVGTCPTTYTASYTGYYRASDYINSVYSTVVGQVAQRFDTSATTYNSYANGLGAGFDLTKLYVCIQLPHNSQNELLVGGGDTVQVYAYYTYHPIGISLGVTTIPLVASSQYVIEG